MESMGKKPRRARRSFTPEFKAEIVELCQRGDRSIGQVAKDFDLVETWVRDWVRQAEIDEGNRAGLTSGGREELAALRRENRRLRDDVEVIKRATAFFAVLAGKLDVRLSVGRTGQCWDNALAEPFFSTLKHKLINTQLWTGRAAAHTAIFEWIESWYNLHRLHSASGTAVPPATRPNS